MAENSINAPYQIMGGKKAVLSLVERFYFFMDTLAETEEIRAMHADDLSNAKEKLFKFLSGWLGGPDIYIREYGHPMLRRRHFPIVIGQQERDQWMVCMHKAMDEIEMDVGLKENLLQALDQLATHMINQ